MRRLFLIVVLIAAAWSAALGQEVAADENGGSFADDLAQWTRLLDRVEVQLADPELSPAALEALRAAIKDVERQADSSRQVFAREIDELDGLISALGEAPAEGGLPEAEEITAERYRLLRERAVPDRKAKQVDLILNRADGLRRKLVQARRAAFARTLLVRTPSLFQLKTWHTAAAEFGTMLHRIWTAPADWARSERVRGELGTGFFAVLSAIVLITVAAAWLLRTLLLRRFGRSARIADPSYRQRILAAVVEGAARGVIPTLTAVVILLIFEDENLLFGLFEDVALGLVSGIVFLCIATGLSRAAFSPRRSAWRLAPFGDRSSSGIHKRLVTLASIYSVNLFFVFPAEVLAPSDTLVNTYNFVTNTAAAAVFLSLARAGLWQSREAEAAADSGAPPPPPRHGRWWVVIRVLAAVIALAIPVTALAGYGVLSEFLASRLAGSALLFGLVLVVRGLVRDVAAALVDPEHGRVQAEQAGAAPSGGRFYFVWAMLALDLVLIIGTVFLLLPIWGGRWGDLLQGTGRAFSGFTVGQYTFALSDVLLGIGAFLVLMALLRLFQRLLENRVLSQTRLDIGARHALSAGIGYVGIVVAAMVAVDIAGIDLSALALIAGALSVGIGFGLQGVVNNFVSGIILLIERPIKVGDWVVVGQHEGYVKKLSVRSTEIETFQRASVIVPNADIVSQSVTNWMHADQTGRVEVAVGVAYGSDVELVRKTLLDCAAAHPDVRAWPEPYVLFLDFGDSALLFELRCFIGNVDHRLSVSSDLRFAVDAAFRDAGIAIPFPQRDLHIKGLDGLARAAIQEEGRGPTSASAPAGSSAPRVAESGEGGDD